MPTLQPGHRIQLLSGGREYFPALIEAIDAATHEVLFETYIFEFDAAGVPVAEALIRAAQRGVSVRLTVDGIGTGPLPPEWGRRFDEAGVRHKVFQPAEGWRRLLPHHWRRLHRKLVLVDGHTAFCGGINVMDDYRDPSHGALEAPRLDFAVRVQGPLVTRARAAMWRLWWRMQAWRAARDRNFEAAWRVVRQARRRNRPATDPAADGIRAGLLLRDNLRFRHRIERAYRAAIRTARKEIIIANAYFVPGVRLRHAIVRAARRGVQVTVLLQGRYEYFLQRYASRAVYAVLLRAGVRIIEYEASFLHAKVAVVDGRWSTVGSSNMEPISLLLAREANVVIDDPGFASQLRQQLLDAIERHGRPINATAHEGRAWRQRLLDWMAYGLMSLAVFLTGKRY